ncbi:MAG: hypothetical protein ACU836_13585 [Gammaproteobacteria bacterium]
MIQPDYCRDIFIRAEGVANTDEGFICDHAVALANRRSANTCN